MTISRERLKQYVAGLDELSRRAQLDLRATFELWLNEGYSLDEALNEVIVVADAASSAYGDMAATLAAEFFEQTALDELGRSLNTELADPLDFKVLKNNIEYAAKNHLFNDKKGVDLDGFLSFLDNIIDTAIKDAARSTTTFNTALFENTGVRYARVPQSATPCAFCIMLAGRGFVYYSAQTAAEIDRYHRNCSCEPVASWDGEVEGYNQGRYEKMYTDALKEVYQETHTSNTQKILETMRRQLGSEECSDHVDVIE